MQAEIIKSAHERGHFALKKTKELINKDYFIPKLDEKIQRHIEIAFRVLLGRIRGRIEGELHTLPKKADPLQKYHNDHVGPLEN